MVEETSRRTSYTGRVLENKILSRYRRAMSRVWRNHTSWNGWASRSRSAPGKEKVPGRRTKPPSESTNQPQTIVPQAIACIHTPEADAALTGESQAHPICIESDSEVLDAQGGSLTNTAPGESQTGPISHAWSYTLCRLSIHVA
ncbi:hypothetical protein BD779DRAFT_1521243 [Infundibulicybe gibba]|nr:hypothetical protein BD779DRAFT_1521243 [Infundibulicybe gibba]